MYPTKTGSLNTPTMRSSVTAAGAAVEAPQPEIATADVQGTGTTLVASNLSVTTTGTINPATGNHAQGLYNGNGVGSDGGPTGGASATLTNVAILTKGFDAAGVDTENGATTTLNGGSVSTTGAASYAVVVNSAGAETANGTALSAAANGSGGFSVQGAGSRLAVSGVTVATLGALDPASGNHSYGLFNGPGSGGLFPSGGVATVADSTISTQGAAMFGIFTGAGASTTLAGTKVSTGGLGAAGVFTDAGGVTNISGGSVSASGQGAHALFVTGSGSQANLSGAGTFATTGAGAIGLYTALGGAISATGSTMTTIATFGGVSPATALGAYGVNADGAGSKVNLASAAIATSGAGATGLYASDRARSGSAGTITATGPLDIQTKSASAAAVALQGDGATIAATGGGTITAAGSAIEFLGGTGQSATFDNFNIGALSGDLVFADPSIATLNFNTTTANAGTGNLLNATAGSAITFNANASMLTGAIQTDAASTSNVNLTNGTTWNLTGSSTVTNLSVAHSIVVFAPPGAGGAFKTLTVTNYVGNGANIAMNVALGGSGSAGDRIIVNGGKATGSTLLTINNAGGLGGQTSGNGIPIVMATNGGAIAANAFSLANTPIAGGFKYTLDQSGGAWFLVSSPTATVAGLTSSINSVAKAQQSQMITNRVLGSLLLGATQQISCSSCGGGFASIGSFALGGSGRWRLSDNLTLLGGLSYNQWSASGITVYNAPTVAGALVYDFNNWGRSRPFLEVGAGLTPYEQVNYSRVYPNGLTTGYGYASAIDRQASLFGRAGWVDRLTPIDEAAAYVDLGRSWMQTGGYSEQMTAINPFPATVPNGLATLNTTRFGVQYTHLFNGNIEANVGAAVAYGFGAGAGAPFNIFEFGTLAPGAIADSAWFEYGARLGYRVTDRVVVDAFLLGTAGGLAGNFVHGGFGVRVAF
ncbi:MAG TPA: autotransporter outer membrane beta-barrel domain-containing protein [Roseiarcus sp.]|nr:autotransporter outer membrane beta-barrel domain-containing protein [Roseiarcus sp.]